MTKTQANEPGFVLAPREPTEAMIAAGYDENVVGYSPDPLPADVVYRAMLAAAPLVPSPAYGGVRALRLEISEIFADARRQHPVPLGLEDAVHQAVRRLSPVAVEEADAKAVEPEQCPDCRGRTFAQVHERKLDGSFGPGTQFRCVECKLVTPSPQIGKAGAGPVGEAVARAPALKSRPLIAENRWHLGAMNDGLFIIDKAPGLTTDAGPWDREDGPEMVLNVVALTHDQAKAIVDAHNNAIAAMIAAHLVEEPGEVERRIVEIIEPKGDENGVWCGSPLEAVIAVQNERDELRADLAETRERLEKAVAPFVAVLDSMEKAAIGFHRETQPEAAAGLDDADLAALVHPDDSWCFTDGSMHNAKRVTVGDLRSLRASLTGDAQEGGK